MRCKRLAQVKIRCNRPPPDRSRKLASRPAPAPPQRAYRGRYGKVLRLSGRRGGRLPRHVRCLRPTGCAKVQGLPYEPCNHSGNATHPQKRSMILTNSIHHMPLDALRAASSPGRMGSVTQNVLPSPRVEVTCTVPPMRLTAFLTIARPIPVPSYSCLVWRR
jgi:hypothetical protein